MYNRALAQPVRCTFTLAGEMQNTKNHWRALEVSVPVNGDSDPWIDGRRYNQITEDVASILGTKGGLLGETSGRTSSSSMKVMEVRFHYWYTDLCEAINCFIDSWGELNYPNRTLITHVERFPDCTFKHHVMIRWIDGVMDPKCTELGSDNLLGPHNS